MTIEKYYRLGVGIFLLNKTKKLWIGKRIDSEDHWQMPQGGVDNKETPLEAMKRELKEEIGTNDVKVLSQTDNWLRYDLPKKLIPKLWNGQFLGQQQKWFACQFNGTDNDINLNLHKPEFREWKWISPTESLKYVVPFKKKVYENVLNLFKEFYS